MDSIRIGELIGLLALGGSIVGVYVGTRTEAAKLASSFNAMAEAMKQIRDDIHEMRKELRSDLQAHSKQLGDLSQRVAVVETKVQ
jgi:methyl-accepting chemotaxis protein